MAPENPTQSKLNLLRANLQQYKESDLFTLNETTRLCQAIELEINQILNNHPEAR